MKATIRGTEIYFDIAGMQFRPVKNGWAEKPVLFLLHGGPGGDHLRYKQHSLELEDTAQLVFIDNRGCGRSKKTRASQYTMENNIRDIEALRKYLGLGRICLLGTSYGGMVAQGYAVRYPENLDKLILVATAPSYRFMDDAKNYLKNHATRKQKNISKHLWNGTFKSPRHVTKYFKLMDSLYSVKAKKRRKPEYGASQTVWSHEALNQGFGGFLRRFDITSKLPNISCKTLILAGQNDWICSPGQSRIIATHIPDARLKIFRDCGHAVAVDAHDQYIKIIRRFLHKP